MPVEVPLTKGFVALVDPEDAERVLQYRWRAIDGNKRGLVYASTGDGEAAPWQAMHRFILRVEARWPDVDHRNGNGLDNQRHNLRVATRSQNCANRDIIRARARNSLGYLGVFRSSGDFFKGRVHKGKTFYTRRFYSPYEAAVARDKLALELFGEFASLNFEDLRSAA